MNDSRHNGCTDQRLAEWSNKATRYEAVSSLMMEPDLPMWDRAEAAPKVAAQDCLILVVPSTTKLFVCIPKATQWRCTAMTKTSLS